jgi:hypothetical protein
MRRETSRVSFLMCLFCVRAVSSHVATPAVRSSVGRRGQGARACAPPRGLAPDVLRTLCQRRPYRDQAGYSSLRQARGSSGSGFGVRSSRNEWYGATNGSGAITV